MISTLERSDTAPKTSGARTLDQKLEVVAIPVADVERSKRFYRRLCWRLDADISNGDAFRVVQMTPPGSACSIHFGIGVTTAEPGTARGLFLVVSDIVAARAELIGRGVSVSDVFHRLGAGEGPVAGPHPRRQTYASYATFCDPDGNNWLLQEVTARLPGRAETTKDTTFSSAKELAIALRRAEAAHGEHEKRMGGQRDANWSDWYAEYMVREQAGQPLPT